MFIVPGRASGRPAGPIRQPLGKSQVVRESSEIDREASWKGVVRVR